MRKIIMIIMIGILMTTIYGCNSNDEINDELISKINLAYNQIHDTDFRYDRYYGKHSDLYVFFVEDDNAIYKEKTIDGFLFSGNSTWHLIGYTDGKFYDLEEDSIILQNDILSHADYQKIYQTHIKY